MFWASSVRRHLREGEMLYLRGAPASACYLVEDGALESYLPTRSSRRYRRVIPVGEIAGAIDLVLDRPYRRNVCASEKATLVMFSRETVMAQLRSGSPLMLGVLQSLARNIDRLSRGGCS